MKCAVTLFALLLLAGCSDLPDGRELGEVSILRTVGLDAVQTGVEITVSAGGQGEQAPLTAQGVSAAEAARNVQKLGDRHIYLGHVEQLVLGEALAVQGVGAVVDYLAREPQLGLGVDLWVVRGAAKDVLCVENQPEVSRRLDLLHTDGRTEAAGVRCTAATLMSVLAQQGSVCIPAVTVAEGDRPALRSGGYAVVRQGKLVTWLEGESAAGYDLLMEHGTGEVCGVEPQPGGTVSMELERVSVDVEPEFRGVELTGLTVRCRLLARVAQQEGATDTRQLRTARLLYEQRQAERLAAALSLSQYWDADFAALERRAMLACPSRKEEITRQFKQLFRSLPIRVVVDARVERDENGA